MKTEDILGYPVAAEAASHCIALISKWIAEGTKNRYFVCVNPHSIEVARQDNIFDEALKHADLVVPDGVGIVIASRILGGTIRGRVTGTDIFLDLSRELNKQKNHSCFFLGSTESTLRKIMERMVLDFPDIRIAGVYSPPFKPEFSEDDTRRMLDAINNAHADILWVGMTAPKQEKWIYLHREKIDVKFIGAIGAVFDFYSGNVKRSHPLFRRMGLEWLPRLFREPRRLWRRNFISTPSFLARIISESLQRK